MADQLLTHYFVHYWIKSTSFFNQVDKLLFLTGSRYHFSFYFCSNVSFPTGIAVGEMSPVSLVISHTPEDPPHEQRFPLWTSSLFAYVHAYGFRFLSTCQLTPSREILGFRVYKEPSGTTPCWWILSMVFFACLCHAPALGPCTGIDAIY